LCGPRTATVHTDREPAMKMPRGVVTKLSLASVVAASAALCWATPDAMGGLIIPDATTYKNTNGSANADALLKPLSASIAVAAGQQINGSSASAGVTYYFGVSGVPNANIPLQIETIASYDGDEAVETGPPDQRTVYSVGGAVSLTTPLFTQTLISAFGGSEETSPVDATVHKVTKLTLMSDTLYTVNMSVEGDILDVFHSLEVVTAFVDPVISFAPGFDSTGFTLEFSPGVGNSFSSETPEPSTLVMASIVFAMWGVVCAYRQLKRTRAAAHAARSFIFVAVAGKRSCVALLILAIILGYAGAANAGTVWHVGDLTTYGQGIWGGDPALDAGATLLVANFDSVYAQAGELVVGSPSGFTMSFDDAQSVLIYAPSIGPYAPLDGSVLDPISTSSGAFGGDVLGLKLNVDFSDAGLLPGASGLRFGDLVLTDFSTLPQLNGLTVRQFLGDMNTLLSGGSSIVSISNLDTLVSDLNASFSSGLFATQFAQDHLEAPSAPVPEPSSWVLWGSGLLCLTAIGRWKRRH
jgi:hypothetical protein